MLPDACRVPLLVLLMSKEDRLVLPHIRVFRDFLTDHVDWRLDPT